MIKLFRFIIKKIRKIKNDKYLKKHFPDVKIDEEWYEKCFAGINILSCKLEHTKLKDIKCLVLINNKWTSCNLNQSPIYQYILSNNKEAYTKYHKSVDEIQKEYVHTYEKFDHLIENIDKMGYDQTKLICVNKNNQIIDGQHRASYLLNKYGEDYETTVFKIYY